MKVTCTADQGCLNAVCIDNPCKAAEDAKSSAGCDYWALKTALRPQADGACFASFVANTWAKNVHLSVTYDGAALDPATFAYIPKIDAGRRRQLQRLTTRWVVCLQEKSRSCFSRGTRKASVSSIVRSPRRLPIETGFSGTGIGKAFHITADYPVTAYQMVPFKRRNVRQVTSATLLAPNKCLGHQLHCDQRVQGDS